jgi:hypothetical protein
MYAFLNTGFFVFHSALIVFILFGWVWKKTRRVHFILSVLTAFSWFILGIWHGFGYCPFTDWHYQVRMKLGHFDMPESYIKFLFHSVTGINVDQRIIDIIAVSILGLALVLSVFLNIKDWRKKRKASAGNGRL